MIRYGLIVVLLCVVGTRLPSVGSLLPDVTTLCPYSNFCYTNTTKSRYSDEMDLTSCCQKCSCDQACQLTGSCCPDMIPMPNVEQKYSCVSLNEYYNDPRGIFALTGVRYRIIDSCPNAVLDLAYPRCSDLVVLEDYVFVSDPLTDLLYRNKHCAGCNGVNHENLIEWNLITDCNPYSSYPTIEKWHDHILRNCSLIPYPPKPSVGQLVKCQPFGVLTRCNLTGDWDVYNVDVKNACELGNTITNSMYTHELKPTTYNRYYKNVYCFLCNTRHDEVLPGLCEKPVAVLPRTFGISIFINFKKQPNEDSTKTEQCYSSQIWNRFNGSCLNVRCPIATYAYKGKCEYLYRHLPQPAYTLMFRLKTDDDAYGIELESFLKGAVSRMLANADCFHCGTSIKIHDNSTYFLTYEVTSQLSCNEEFIVSKMKQFLKRSPIRLRFQNKTQITMVPELSLLELRNFRSVVRSGYCTQTPFFITWALVDRCPRIPISSLDIDEFTTVITSERNGTICVEEYFRILMLLNNCDILVSCQVYLVAIVACAFTLKYLLV